MSLLPSMRLSLLATAVAVLAGCATPPPPAPAPSNPPPSTAEPAAIGTAPAPGPVAEPPPPVPSGPVSAAQQQQAQSLARAAIDMLERGKEDEAKAELQSALNVDPNNALAQNLMRQITVDPITALGKESFSYTVRRDDTLSIIAKRFMNDVFSFYILARYNDIKVPRLVSAGQVIRVPGRPPAGGVDAPAPRPSPPAATNPPPAPPAPAPAAPVSPPPPAAPPAPAEPTPGVKAMRSAEAAERAGDLDRALAEYNRAAGLDQAGAAVKVSDVRKKLVQRHTQSARAAMAKQDVDGSIRSWDRVLELEPGNETAKLERQRAVGLKEKLKGLGK
jgi:tetratricopeptide (TPR) repeat protein